jgi:hypothetical protein
VAIALVGVALCLAVSLRDASRGRHATNRSALGAALVLALGVILYGATRAAAADMRLPIPHVPPNQRCAVESGGLPPIGDRCVGVNAPVLELSSTRRILKHLAGGPVEISSSGNSFGEQLDAKRRLWMSINPAQKFHASLGLVVASDVSVASIDFAQIYAAGFHHVFLLMHSPASRVETNTLGVVSLWSRCCAVEIHLDPGGETAKNHATYSDLVRAANDATARGRLLTLAP